MIGNRLKVTRQAAGLSLRALSDRIDNRVSAQAIGKYERDEAMPRSQVLVVLAEALNVSVAYLAGWLEHSAAGRELSHQEGDKQARGGPDWRDGSPEAGALPCGRGDTQYVQHQLGQA